MSPVLYADPSRALRRFGTGEVVGTWSGGDDFVSGLASDGVTRQRGTRPTPDNTGATGTLRPYNPAIDGAASGGLLTVTTPGRVYEDVDFGNIKVRVRAPDVGFSNCAWNITDFGSYDFAVDFRHPDNTGGGWMNRCTVINSSQQQVGSTGVYGWNVTVTRCRIEDFVDQVGFYVPGSPGTSSLPIGVTVLDTYLGPLAWFWASTGGVVHPSDWKTHCDSAQLQGGYGAVFINTTLLCHFSGRIGTGTPGSGSEYGTGAEYTQAQGEAERFAYLLDNGARTPEPDGTVLGWDGAGIMVNSSSSKGNRVEMEIAYCWGSGGAYWLNVASGNQGDFGSIYGCRVRDNQRHPGRAIVIPAHLTATVTDNEWVDEDWEPTGQTITRRTS